MPWAKRKFSRRVYRSQRANWNQSNRDDYNAKYHYAMKAGKTPAEAHREAAAYVKRMNAI